MVEDAVLQAPFTLLCDMDRRARTHAASLPQQRKALELWHGIGFRCAGLSLLVGMDEIREVQPVTNLTMVPGAKPWLRGVANVRGVLMPVMDLAGFLGKATRAATNHARILVVNHPVLNAALLVDELAGLHHYPRQDLQTPTSDMALDEAIRPYAQGVFERQQTWAVLALQRLIQDPEFLNVAA